MIRIKEKSGFTNMIKRRKFLIWGSLLGIGNCLNAKTIDSFEIRFQKVFVLIEAVQEVMFPKGTKLPNAKNMHLTQFLYETIIHHSYDKDIRKFVLEGAEEFLIHEKNFIAYSKSKKERAMRKYEKKRYGKNWLSRIMTLSMEGLFSDPIYGGNVNEEGWKAIHAFGGYPRPKTRYLQNV